MKNYLHLMEVKKDNMDKELQKFERYLKTERNYSEYTIKNYRIDILEFINYYKNYTSITYKDIKGYLSYLYNNKYKNSTISRKISALRTFYSYLYEQKLVDKNIFKSISLPKKEKKLPKYLNICDLECIFNTPDINTPIGIRNRLILELLYATGMRVSELSSIKIKDIDLSNKTIRIIGKGSKERIVCYGSECEKILNLYLKDSRKILLNNKNNDYLIIGKGKSKKGLSVRSIEKIIDEVITTSAINKKISPHVLRHTFATHLLNEGCDILIVKELLGHSSLDTTGIYTHISNEKLRKVYLESHPRAKNH